MPHALPLLLLLLLAGYTHADVGIKPRGGGGAEHGTATQRVRSAPRAAPDAPPAAAQASPERLTVLGAPRVAPSRGAQRGDAADSSASTATQLSTAAAATTTFAGCTLSGWSAWSACSPARAFPRPPRATVAAWTLPPAGASRSSDDDFTSFQSLAHVCAGDGCFFLPDLSDGHTGSNAAPPLPRLLPTAEEVEAAAAPLRPRCGSRDGTRAEARSQAAAVAAASKAGPDGRGGIYVRLIWHVVHSGTSGKLSREALSAQVAHLNAAWAGAPGGAAVAWRADAPRATGVLFSLADADVIEHADAAFFTGCSPDSAPAKSAAWNVDTRHSLNVYSCAPANGLLGWTSFPADMRGEDDGAHGAVFVRFDTLPGVAASGQYNLGNTLVHEAGHYFGLFHVFQGESCAADDAAGDGVADTPPQRTPTYGGCAANRAKATCPPMLDGITNYMDYSDDACMRVFTPQQAIRETIRVYRPSLYDNPSPCPSTRQRTRRVTAGEPCAAAPVLLEAQCC